MAADQQLTAAEERFGPGVRIPPPVVLATWIGIGLLLRWYFPTPLLPQLVAWWSGGVLIVAGLGTLSWCLQQFRKNETALLPHRPDSKLILGGLYRHTRNPIYLSLVVIHIGTGLAFNSGVVLAMVIPLILTLQLYVIRKEERYLTRRFGASYEEYCRSVRRWL
ncbi:MAG: isoprenylcysteine carboxylmethyltransferase family protein [Planctomycetota bacterium]